MLYGVATLRCENRYVVAAIEPKQNIALLYFALFCESALRNW